MENVQVLLEKVAARKQQKPKQRKKKPAGGRKPRDVYAPDMSKGAPGANKLKPSQDLTSKANKFKADKPTPEVKPLKPKKVMSGSEAASFKPSSSPKGTSLTRKAISTSKAAHIFTPKKLGLIAGGAAGAGILAAKIRSNRKAKENS